MCKTETKRSQLFNMFGGKCAYCERQMSKKSMTRDHLLAKADGGGSTLENLLPACKQCNQRKGHSSLEAWRVDFFMPTLTEEEKSSRERMFAAIATKKFYFERVAEDQMRKSLNKGKDATPKKEGKKGQKESNSKEKKKDFSPLTDERLKKMESDACYRAMLKVLGLLSIAHQELRHAISRYRSWEWSDTVFEIEEKHQVVLAMADNVGRIRNLFLDIVETRYGTREIKSLERLDIDNFPDDAVISEIDRLEEKK